MITTTVNILAEDNVITDEFIEKDKLLIETLGYDVFKLRIVTTEENIRCLFIIEVEGSVVEMRLLSNGYVVAKLQKRFRQVVHAHTNYA